jgi:hypothetical protein
MSAAILTPAYTHAHPQLTLAVVRSGIPWLQLHGHSDLPRVRSVLLEQGLARGVDRLILVDADVVPTVETLRALAESPDVTPARAIWGLYPLREGDRWSVNPKDPEEAQAAIVARNLFPIRTGGLGLCAIHRESLERVGATLPTIAEEGGTRWRPFCVPIVDWTIVESGVSGDATYYADDGALCVRLRGADTEIMCDPAIRAPHAVTALLNTPRG